MVEESLSFKVDEPRNKSGRDAGSPGQGRVETGMGLTVSGAVLETGNCTAAVFDSILEPVGRPGSQRLHFTFGGSRRTRKFL